MTEWLRAELRRLRAPLLLFGLLHFLALAVLARFMSPLLWPLPLLGLLAGALALVGLLLGAWQWQAWTAPARWLTLLHQPLPAWRCALPLVAAGALLLAAALALPILLALPVLGLFGHGVSAPHAGYALLAWCLGLSGYFCGMAAVLGRGSLRWLVLALLPAPWLLLGAQPLPPLLLGSLVALGVLAALALHRVRPDLSRARAGGLELLLLVPACWLGGAAVQMGGQGLLLLLERHPAVNPAGPAHFEHWRGSQPADLLSALWPASGLSGWPAQPMDAPSLRSLYPAHPLPDRWSPGSEAIAQLRLPGTGERAGYDASRTLLRVTDARRQTRAWLGRGCPVAQAPAAQALGPALPLPVQGGVLLGTELLAWQGDCLQPVAQADAPLLDAVQHRDGWLLLNPSGLHWHPQRGPQPASWAWPRPLPAVQTLLLWRHPQEARWLLVLLEGRFMQPADGRLSLWELRPGAAPQALAERRLAADFHDALLWSDTWPTPLRGLFQAASEPVPRPPLPPSVLALLVASSLLAAGASGALSRRRQAAPRGAWAWLLGALAVGPPLLVLQLSLQARRAGAH